MKSKLQAALKLLRNNLTLNQSESNALDSIETKINDIESTKSSITSDIPPHKDLLNGKFEIIVYSDGACRGNPGPGSYGLYVELPKNNTYSDSESFENTTNNKMELLGIIKGLKFAAKSNAKSVLVVTDSKYAINGMESWMANWKARGWKKADKKTPENVEMWQELDLLKDNFSNLKFEWVKGHSGHPQNELCDQMANKALDESGF